MTSKSVFNRPPLNLEELNQRLELCIKNGSFQSLDIRTEGNESQPSLTQIFEAIRFPLQSFPDRRDEAKIKTLKRHLVTLFPFTPENTRVYQTITQALNAIAAPPPPPSAAPAFRLAQAMQLYSTAQVLKNSGMTPMVANMDTLSSLKITSNHVCRNPSKRLEDAMNYAKKPTSDTERAQKLQTLLSLIRQEWRLIAASWREVLCALSSNQADAEFKKGGLGTVSISANLESTVIDCPETVNSSEEFAFRLQIPQICLQCARFVERCIKDPNADYSLQFSKLFQKLSALAKEESPKKEGWNSIIESVMAFVQAKYSLVQFLKSAAHLVKISAGSLDSESRLHKEGKRWLDMEDLCAPYASFMLSLLKRKQQEYALRVRLGNPQHDLDLNYYRELQTVCEQFLKDRRYQAALYQFAYQELNILIQKHQNTREWARYLQDLSSQHLAERVLPPTLAEFQAAFQPLTIEKLESKVEELISPPVAVPPLTSVTEKLPITEPPRAEIKAPAAPSIESVSRATETAPAAVPSSLSSELRQPTITREPPLEPVAPVTTAQPERMVKKFPYAFAKRVQRWRECSIDQPLNERVFWDYHHFSPQHQRKMKIYHGFSSAIDQFYDMGIQTTWSNPTTNHKDTLYVIPTEITVDDVTSRRFLIYCIGQDNVCYHVGIEEHLDNYKISDREFIQKVINKTFNETDFPSLKIHQYRPRDLQPTETIDEASNDPVSIHPILGTVTIVDRRLNATIKLYRVTPST